MNMFEEVSDKELIVFWQLLNLAHAKIRKVLCSTCDNEKAYLFMTEGNGQRLMGKLWREAENECGARGLNPCTGEVTKDVFKEE